jgi:nitrilase
MNHKAAVVQMVSSGDVHANLSAASRLIAQAQEQGAGLILLPENFGCCRVFSGSGHRKKGSG